MYGGLAHDSFFAIRRENHFEVLYMFVGQQPNCCPIYSSNTYTVFAHDVGQPHACVM